MQKTYLPYHQDQLLFLPISVRDWSSPVTWLTSSTTSSSVWS